MHCAEVGVIAREKICLVGEHRPLPEMIGERVLAVAVVMNKGIRGK